jgi:hypothetical protein
MINDQKEDAGLIKELIRLIKDDFKQNNEKIKGDLFPFLKERVIRV